MCEGHLGNMSTVACREIVIFQLVVDYMACNKNMQFQTACSTEP